MDESGAELAAVRGEGGVRRREEDDRRQTTEDRRTGEGKEDERPFDRLRTFGRDADRLSAMQPKEVFSKVGKRYRVKVDLTFEDPRMAFAFSRICSSFQTSSVRCDGKAKKLGRVLSERS